MADFRTPLARVRGLGSAKSGTRHWWRQRVTAVANALLVAWFAASMAALAGSDIAAYSWWVRDPVVTVLLLLLIGNLFYHLALGLQVVIEDYVHAEVPKIASLLAIRGGCILLALLGIVSVLKISLGGS